MGGRALGASVATSRQGPGASPGRLRAFLLEECSAGWHSLLWGLSKCPGVSSIFLQTTFSVLCALELWRYICS